MAAVNGLQGKFVSNCPMSWRILFVFQEDSSLYGGGGALGVSAPVARVRGQG